MSEQSCSACGRVTPQAFRFHANGCGIWQCVICGLGRADTKDFDPAAYYTADYFSGGRSDGYSDYRGAEPVLRREFAHSADFVRRFSDGSRLLDLGCAYGFFLKEAAKRQFEVLGIELAEDAAEVVPTSRAECAFGHCRRDQYDKDRGGRCHHHV